MKRILLMAIALFCLPALAYADGFTVFATRADLNATDSIDWAQLGASGTLVVSNSAVTTVDGNAGSAGNLGGAQFLRLDEGMSWFGNFTLGEPLVFTNGSSVHPFGISLANPVGGFGFNIEADTAYGNPFDVFVQAFDSSSHLLFTTSFTGMSTGSEDGTALFVGAGDTTGVNISRIVISTSAPGNDFNRFAIDNVGLTYTTATVPEPSSLVLLGSGLLGMAGLLRRKLSV